MSYCIFKLRFTAPLHCGAGNIAKSLDTALMTPCADTLFSALCITALKSGGTGALNELCSLAGSGKLLLSDMMPYDKQALYIPRPRIRSAVKNTAASAEDRKAMKKLSHIPVSSLPALYVSLRGKEAYKASDNKGDFGTVSIAEKNSIGADGMAVPYHIGVFSFNDGCGLWFIAGFADDSFVSRFESLLTDLGLGGMGGRVSSGYGKFCMAESTICLDKPSDVDTETLAAMLADNAAPLQISLTTSLPADGELEKALNGASYGLTRRGGFAASETLSATAVRKRTQYFLSAGSVFTMRYEGSLFNAAEHGTHPVYRYGKPIFLGAEKP